MPTQFKAKVLTDVPANRLLKKISTPTEIHLEMTGAGDTAEFRSTGPLTANQEVTVTLSDNPIWEIEAEEALEAGVQVEVGVLGKVKKAAENTGIGYTVGAVAKDAIAQIVWNSGTVGAAVSPSDIPDGSITDAKLANPKLDMFRVSANVDPNTLDDEGVYRSDRNGTPHAGMPSASNAWTIFTTIPDPANGYISQLYLSDHGISFRARINTGWLDWVDVIKDSTSGPLINDTDAWTNLQGKPTTFPADLTEQPASNITSGTFAAARIPTLAQSKITNLTTDLGAKLTATQGAAFADLTDAPTMADFNNLLANLRTAGIIAT